MAREFPYRCGACSTNCLRFFLFNGSWRGIQCSHLAKGTDRWIAALLYAPYRRAGPYLLVPYITLRLTNVKSRRVRMCRIQQQIFFLSSISTDFFQIRSDISAVCGGAAWQFVAELSLWWRHIIIECETVIDADSIPDLEYRVPRPSGYSRAVLSHTQTAHTIVVTGQHPYIHSNGNLHCTVDTRTNECN